jgi:hypothetical protein
VYKNKIKPNKEPHVPGATGNKPIPNKVAKR